MKLTNYPLAAEDNLKTFEFISEGPNGLIKKMVQFTPTNLQGFYILAFGDKDSSTGELDDLAISNNNDTERILATVAASVYAFTDKYPEAWIYATGSTNRNNLPSGVDASYPGYGVPAWNGTGTPPTYYWTVEYTGNLIPPPSIYCWVQGFNISTTVAGIYTFNYIIHGPCGTTVWPFIVNFFIGTATTYAPPSYFTNCNSVTSITNATMLPAPNYGAGEYCLWTAPSGSGLTFSNANYHITDINNINPNLDYNITYQIFSASSATCFTTSVYVIRRKVVPIIHTSYPVNLPCGTTNANIYYWATEAPNGTAVLQNNVITYSNINLISCPNPANPPVITYNSSLVTNFTLPGAYVFEVNAVGNCGDISSEIITINVEQPADAPSSGSPITLPCNVFSTPIIASATVVGNGSWQNLAYAENSNLIIGDYITIPSQLAMINPSVTIGTINYPAVPGNYIFDWAVSNPYCGGGQIYHGYSTVIVPNPNITTADAGADISVCQWEDINLSANASNGAIGFWSSPNPGIVFSNPTSPNTTITSGITASNTIQTYTFTWNVSNGCSVNLNDDVIVTIDPAVCCLASADPAYTHIPTNTIYTTNTVLSGKLYLEDIITVDGVVLDITNVDMVFSSCAGIHFINGATIRSNNSVFRACGLQDSWLGFSFDDASNGIIEACSFKNAVIAIGTSAGNFDIRLINNNFINCKNSLATDGSEFNGIISGNNFTVDQSYINFSSCTGQNNDDYFGIVANSTNFISGISQNNFVYSANIAINIFYGIFLGSSSAVIDANKFSNLYRSVDVTSNSTADISNNNIEISGWQTNTQHSIRVTELSQCNILGNSIACSMHGNKQTTALTNAAIYMSHNNEMPNIIADNQINNFETGIQLLYNENVYVTNNKISNCINYAIYSLNNLVNASCNEIDMGITKTEKSIGIAHINENNISYQNSWSNASFRSNCISECHTAIYIEDYNCSAFAAINNNFLYNYTSYGIFATDATLQIGSNQLFGANSFVSNNYQSGTQAVDVYSDNCNGSAIGNFGILNVSNNITVSGSNRLHSTATCAKQVNDGISLDPYNASQQFTPVQMCNEFDINSMSFGRREMGQIVLTDNWYNLFIDLAEENSLEVAASILNTASNLELDLVYNKLKNEYYNNQNDRLFLEIVYLNQKAEFEQAITKLNNIVTTNENEKDLKDLMQIQLYLLKNNKPLRSISDNDIANLTTIDAKQGIYAAKAKDLLQVANGKNDYRFQKTKSLSLTTKRSIVNMDESNLAVYPNPASDNLTLELINAIDENTTVNIFDALGQRIYQARENIKAGKLTIDISTLAKGMYHVQLLSVNNKSHSSSFIKQ